MFKFIKQLFAILSPQQKRKFCLLQLLAIISAIVEIVAIGSIIPFMTLMGDSSVLESDNLLAKLYQVSGVANQQYFILLLGLVLIVATGISSLIAVITVWQLCYFAARLGGNIADQLYQYYMQQNWLFHTNSSSAQLTKQIAVEAHRLAAQVVQPLMLLNAKLILVIFIVISAFMFNPWITLCGFTLLAGSYFILFMLVRNRIHNTGNVLSQVATERFRFMNEGFGGIKDVMLLGRQAHFIDKFICSSHASAAAQGLYGALSQMPRYIMEFIAVLSIAGLMLLLLVSNQENLIVVLPTLSVYGMAGFKLLYALQNIYSGLAQIKAHAAAFEAIEVDLINAKQQQVLINNCTDERLLIKNKIELVNITFTYPSKSQSILNKLNLSIKANQTIGIVGSSGVGKSTIVDVLLALIQPEQGQLLVDKVPINQNNRRLWQNNIGLVAQSIFLTEGSIAENIAFGVAVEQINKDKVWQVVQLSHLNELVSQLPGGLDTKVGERGVKLSGGQRQRIGIARALYHNAGVLVFDEATSSLDGITERLIMDAIHDFSGKKTIIMIAHRLKTIQKCDVIFHIENGRVIYQGNYQELIENSSQFKKMAFYA